MATTPPHHEVSLALHSPMPETHRSNIRSMLKLYGILLILELSSTKSSLSVHPFSGDYLAIISAHRYSRFHIKGTWSVHSLNGDYLSIPKGTGSCGYLFHEIPSS